MPALAAMLIRVLIQAAVQTGIYIAIEKLISPLTDGAKEAYANLFGLSPEEAEDSIANTLIDAFAMIGIIGISIKTKIPTKVAEKLGFTSKGYTKRKLSAKAEAAAKTTAKVGRSTAAATPAEIDAIATTVAKSKGLGLSSVKSLLSIIATIVGVPTAFFFALAQYIDFANWQGPYQKTAQKVMSYFGLNPDTPMPNARTVSDDVWKKIYATIEELGPIGISFPFSGVDKPYSRQTLVDLVNEVAANITLSGGTANFKNVMGVVLPLVQLGGKTGTTAFDPAKSIGEFADGEFVPNVKVFSGVVSQGKIGGDFTFTPRPDDLIESMAELQSAINNNVAPYLAQLGAKIVYEIKTTSSVIVDGLRQLGKAQTVQRGNFTNGKPRMQTVVNKFVVADLYFVKDSDSRIKLDSLVLGPVDALKFNPTTTELVTVAAKIPTQIIATNTDQISEVVSSTPTVATKRQTEPVIMPAERSDAFLDAWNVSGKTILDYIRSINMSPIEAYDKLNRANTFTGNRANALNELTAFIQAGGTVAQAVSSPAPVSSSSSPISVSPTTTGQQAGSISADGMALQATSSPAATLWKASTLFEYYQALGKALPSIAERAKLYESLGLGKADFYVASAEQNTKLLYKLQGDPL